MNQLEAALLEIVGFLEARQIPYMVVGGFATLHWGRPRLTRDLDLTVDVPANSLGEFVAALERDFKLPDPQPLEFAHRNHLVRIATRVSVPVNLMLAWLPYQVAAIGRALEVPAGPRAVRLCSPEDLVIYKLASERTQDHVDVEGVILRQGDSLDRVYLDGRVRELAAGLERPGVLQIYAAALAKAGLPQPRSSRERHDG